MKIYCVYGHGKPTEVRLLRPLPAASIPISVSDTLTPPRRPRPRLQRSYWYTQQEYEYDEIQPDTPVGTCQDDSPESGANCTSPRPPLDMPLSRSTFIDAEYTDEALTPPVVNGVRMGEGDGTVGLLSLGAMCVEGWKRERWNPAGIKVTTVEVRAADSGWV